MGMEFFLFVDVGKSSSHVNHLCSCIMLMSLVAFMCLMMMQVEFEMSTVGRFLCSGLVQPSVRL